MSTITIVRTNGVSVYLDDDENQHILIGHGENDLDALTAAISDLTAAVESIQAMIPEYDPDALTGCADDGDDLSLALRKISPEKLNELLKSELGPR